MLPGKKTASQYLGKVGVSDMCFIVVLAAEHILVLTDNGSRIGFWFLLVSYAAEFTTTTNAYIV